MSVRGTWYRALNSPFGVTNELYIQIMEWDTNGVWALWSSPVAARTTGVGLVLRLTPWTQVLNWTLVPITEAQRRTIPGEE